jgi:5'(3')-deoxyribonucleotidase
VLLSATYLQDYYKFDVYFRLVGLFHKPDKAFFIFVAQLVVMKIAVDMDGVLADVYSSYIRLHEQEFGERKTLASIEGLEEWEGFPQAPRYVRTPGFFENLQVIPGAVTHLKQLNEIHEIFIVSAAIEFPLSLNEKLNWLSAHFPFLSWKQIVFCGSKNIIQADVMIDDHFKNLDGFNGRTLLFHQPHNAKRDPGRHLRVHDWEQISQLL